MSLHEYQAHTALSEYDIEVEKLERGDAESQNVDQAPLSVAA